MDATYISWAGTAIVLASFAGPPCWARWLQHRGTRAQAGALERLRERDGYLLLASERDYELATRHAPPRPYGVADQAMRDARSPGGLPLLLAIVMFFVAYAIGSDIGDLFYGAGLLAFYIWAVRRMVSGIRNARLTVVRVSQVSAPTWGSGALAHGAVPGGQGYGVPWAPCAAMLAGGPVELLVLDDGNRGGNALAMRRAVD